MRKSRGHRFWGGDGVFQVNSKGRNFQVGRKEENPGSEVRLV
jgi:hypothetical protein